MSSCFDGPNLVPFLRIPLLRLIEIVLLLMSVERRWRLLVLLMMMLCRSWLSASDELEWLLDGLRNWWSFWQMSSLCSESQLISDVTNFNKFTIWRSVRIRTLSNLSRIWTATVLQISMLFTSNSISCGVCILVTSIMMHLILEWSDWYLVSILKRLGEMLLLMWLRLEWVLILRLPMTLHISKLRFVKLLIETFEKREELRKMVLNINYSYLFTDPEMKFIWEQTIAHTAKICCKENILILVSLKITYARTYWKHFEYSFLIATWVYSTTSLEVLMNWLLPMEIFIQI